MDKHTMYAIRNDSLTIDKLPIRSFNNKQYTVNIHAPDCFVLNESVVNVPVGIYFTDYNMAKRVLMWRIQKCIDKLNRQLVTFVEQQDKLRSTIT